MLSPFHGLHSSRCARSRVGCFPHAMRDRSGTRLQILFDAVTDFTNPFIFEIRRSERTCDGNTDRQTYGAEHQRLSLEQI